MRPRLLELALQRFDRRVLAIVAGAGFGKTTLLAQAVGENRLAGAGRDVWIGCTRDHAAVSLVVEDVLAGLGLAAPAALPADAHAAAQIIAEAVWSAAPTDVALIFDDLHLLSEGSAGLAVIRQLIEVLPHNGHLVLSSRAPSPVPMARLVANGSGVLIQEAELAFAAGELEEFAASRRVPAELIGEISGWPALAELIATTGRRQVVDYLWEEVIAAIPPERRRVVSILAAIGGADDDLISELVGHPLALSRVLEGLPLVSVAGGWWSLHRLWESALGEFALGEFALGDGGLAVGDPELAAAVAAAPSALRRRGLLRQSMSLSVSRAAWDEVADLIVEACYGISPALPTDVLAGWWAALPDGLRREPPGRLLAATVATADRPAAAREDLELAATGFRERGDHTGEMACLDSLFHIAFWHSDLKAMRPILRRWDELAKEGVLDAVHAATLGRALMTDSPVEARRELERLPAQASGPFTPLVGWLRAHLLLLTIGDPAGAASTARATLDSAPVTLRSAVRCEVVESLRLLGRSDEALAEAALMLVDHAQDAVRSPRHLTAAIVLRSFLGQPADDLLPDLAVVAQSSALPWADLAEHIGCAAVFAGTDDAGAAAALAGDADHPMAWPLVLLRISPAALPLHYVLSPATRTRWEETELLGAMASARRVARAVVALREAGDPSGAVVRQVLDELSDVDLQSVVGQWPVAWLSLLAAGLEAAGHDAGSRIVRRLGPTARPTLRQIDDEAGPLAPSARLLRAIVPSTPLQAVRVEVLGPLRLFRDGEEVDDANARRMRVQQLLGYLVVNGQASRHELTSTLWPDKAEAVAASNLRVTLNYVQHLLEPARDERDAPFFLRAKGSLLHLVVDPALQLDLREFEADLDHADRAEQQGAPSVALSAYLRAIECYAGDLLADLPAEGWLELERDRIRRRFLRAVLRAGQLTQASGDHDRAEDLALRALACEPWSEEAYRMLASAQLAADDRAAAQRTLDRMFAMLDEADLPASQAAFDLAGQLRGGPRVPQARSPIENVHPSRR